MSAVPSKPKANASLIPPPQTIRESARELAQQFVSHVLHRCADEDKWAELIAVEICRHLVIPPPQRTEARQGREERPVDLKVRGDLFHAQAESLRELVSSLQQEIATLRQERDEARYKLDHALAQLRAALDRELWAIKDAQQAESQLTVLRQENERATTRAIDFQIEKNHVLTPLYLSHATTEEAVTIESLLCQIVNQFMDDCFPNWRALPPSPTETGEAAP